MVDRGKSRRDKVSLLVILRVILFALVALVCGLVGLSLVELAIEDDLVSVVDHDVLVGLPGAEVSRNEPFDLGSVLSVLLCKHVSF